MSPIDTEEPKPMKIHAKAIPATGLAAAAAVGIAVATCAPAAAAPTGARHSTAVGLNRR